MKKTNFIILLLTLMFCISTVVSAQATVATIDAYCKTVDALTKKSKEPHLIAADTSDYENANATAKWQKFATEKELEKFRETTETYSIAMNWKKNGKIVASNFTLFSPSGDWAKYVFQYFREDGTLAKVKVDYRTFMGDLIILQDIYFNAAGKLLKKTNRFEDLTTHKPKKVKKDSYDPGMLNEVDYYKTTRKLPFAKLITAK